MRPTYLILLLLIISLGSFGQMNDKVWAIGTPISKITFQNDSVISDTFPNGTLNAFLTMGSICDDSGNFLFCTNGIDVLNRLGQIMPHGDFLSAPPAWSNTNYNQVVQGGMPSREGVVILPKPGDPNLYYIFHYSPVDTDFIPGGYESLNLYYSVVDMTQDNGNGDIIRKNVPLVQNELLSYSRMSACRHANGRDWWIVKNAWHENLYYTFLLDTAGIHGPFIQQMVPRMNNRVIQHSVLMEQNLPRSLGLVM